MPLTAVPQRTALSHAFGGLAAGLVGTAKFYCGWAASPRCSRRSGCSLVAEIILGTDVHREPARGGKLQEVSWIPQRPLTYKGQNAMNLGLLGIAVLCGIAVVTNPAQFAFLFPVIIALALTFGVLLIIPIGGADMPTVIALLNSYAGLSAVAMGFVLDNKVLITAGALDGSSV